MNERLKALANQAGFYGDPGFSEQLERFAELIIREHLTVWDQMDNGNTTHGYTEMEDYPLAVVKHFGVKW